MVNAGRSPALRACAFSTFVISGADMGVFPLMGVLVFGRRELLGKSYPCVMFHPSAVPIAMYCSIALTGHVVIRLVSYSTVHTICMCAMIAVRWLWSSTGTCDTSTLAFCSFLTKAMYCVTKLLLNGLPVLSVPFKSCVIPRSRSYAMASLET